MLKLLTYSCLLFSGKNRAYFRDVRNRRSLQEKVQIHHIIPREFKRHPTIIFSDYEIENGYNMMFLPTDKGAECLNLHIDRPLHYRGHLQYNRYVGNTLDQMFAEDKTSQEDLCKFNQYLRENMRHLDIPWN